jgi:hypothetical protein
MVEQRVDATEGAQTREGCIKIQPDPIEIAGEGLCAGRDSGAPRSSGGLLS